MGKQLMKIHRYNAWVVIWLAITGVMLYLPQLRGVLAPIRVPLKNIHIAIGVVSILIIISYFPYLKRHWLSLRKEKSRRTTIVVALILLAGWVLSGVLLWWERSFPAGWAAPALLVHDILTWAGIPWIIGHSYVSTRRQDARRQAHKSPTPAVIADLDAQPAMPSYGRRTFLRMGLIAATVVGLGVPVFMMMKRLADNGGSDVGEFVARDGNNMVPPPMPAPESLQVIGGGMKGRFRVYTVTEIPRFSSDTWQFTVKGLIDRPIQLNWEQFLKMKRKVQVSDFHCVTGWSVNQITWEGIPLWELLDHVGVQPSGQYVKFYSGDKVYTDALSLEQARMQDVMVAVLMDGKPIPQELGGPIRLIIPKMYAYKSVKWLESIEVIAQSHIGYWERLGYSNDAWVKGES